MTGNNRSSNTIPVLAIDLDVSKNLYQIFVMFAMIIKVYGNVVVHWSVL